MFRERAKAGGLQPATLAVRAGRGAGSGEPLSRPPVFASAFHAGGEGSGYARCSNPTWEALEEALGVLDGGTAVTFSSGMAAASAALGSVPAGGTVAVAANAHVEVRRLLVDRAERGQIGLMEIDALDAGSALRESEGASLVWLDAIANPWLDIPDLDAILAACRQRGTATIVDATLATPMGMRPIELGADLVLHSATKYIGGHSDLVLGALVARDPARAAELAADRGRTGAVPGVMEAWLALRGLRTLALRVERGATSAARIARQLALRPDVLRVRYPGLPGDPAHAPASRLLDGFGAVVSFDLGSAAAADHVCDRVDLITHAGSVGGVETLIERQARWHDDPRVPPGLLRLSLGCEDPVDLWRDLEAALDAA